MFSTQTEIYSLSPSAQISGSSSPSTWFCSTTLGVKKGLLLENFSAMISLRVFDDAYKVSYVAIVNNTGGVREENAREQFAYH